jgi:hypothetical protein
LDHYGILSSHLLPQMTIMTILVIGQ